MIVVVRSPASFALTLPCPCMLQYYALQILETVIKTRWKILPRNQCEGNCTQQFNCHSSLHVGLLTFTHDKDWTLVYFCTCFFFTLLAAFQTLLLCILTLKKTLISWLIYLVSVQHFSFSFLPDIRPCNKFLHINSWRTKKKLLVSTNRNTKMSFFLNLTICKL